MLLSTRQLAFKRPYARLASTALVWLAVATYPSMAAEVHGTKFHDQNGNGVRDNGEPGLPDWTIRAVSQNDSFVTVTDGNGDYTLVLPADSYTVSEDPQSGWTQTHPPNPGTYDIILSPGNEITGVDFGNWQPPPVEIHGTKFEDLNGNGVRDNGEPGLPGWTIRVVSQGLNATTLTDNNGDYSFTGLPADSYTVSEDPQPGWVQTYPPNPGIHDIILSPGSVVTGVDFGNWQPPPAEVHGTKWNDLNGNGVRDNGEPGLPGWTIRAVSQNDSFVTVTDGNGDYTLVLPADSYTVSEDLQPGWVQTYPPNPGIHDIILSPGSFVTGVDFGNHQPAPSEIQGSKWADLDANGVWDPGEAGLAGWTIELDGPSGILTMTTDALGNYAFTSLLAGSYMVSEHLMPGWLQTFPADGAHNVVLGTGEVLADINFGNFSLAAASSGEADLLQVNLFDGSLLLTWDPSCVPTDTDYAIYEGKLGSWYSHVAALCTTGGLVQAILPLPLDDAYYLVVPASEAAEGSYGQSASGSERPQGLAFCAAQSVAPCP